MTFEPAITTSSLHDPRDYTLMAYKKLLMKQILSLGTVAHKVRRRLCQAFAIHYNG